MAELLHFIYTQLFLALPHPTTSFAGKTVIVTGANVGLGKEAAQHIARLGASTLIIAVRDLKKGEAAKQDILETTSVDPSTIQVWHLDLASYESVISFAERAGQLPRIDYVIENAGVATEKFKLQEVDEATITINVVSTFLLALLLLPKLKDTAAQHGVRPILSIVSSGVHGWVSFSEWTEPAIFPALSDPSKAKMKERYPLSKLLEVLVVREWAAQRPAMEYPVTINMINPGLCHSELGRDAGIRLTILKMLLARTTEYGSRTLVDAVTQGPETHGMYLSDCQVEMPSQFVRSEDGKKAQAKVWAELKEKLEKIKPGVTGNL